MESIKLTDFVRDALKEIAQGVRQANIELEEELKKSGGGGGPEYKIHATGGDRKQKGIEFDVAVVAYKDAQGGAGIRIPILGVGVEGGSGSEMTHRIRFEIGAGSNFG